MNDQTKVALDKEVMRATNLLSSVFELARDGTWPVDSDGEAALSAIYIKAMANFREVLFKTIKKELCE